MKNKSYLCNRMSYIELSYIIEVKCSLFCPRKKNQGQNLKTQAWTSFKVNDLKNGSTKCFENNLKSTHFTQRLISSMNCRSRSNKNQMASAARGEKQRQTWNYVPLELNDKSIEMAETVTKIGNKCDIV